MAKPRRLKRYMTAADAHIVQTSMQISASAPHPQHGILGIIERWTDGPPQHGIWVMPAWAPALASGIIFGTPDSHSPLWTVRSHCVEFDRLATDRLAVVGGLKSLFYFWAQQIVLHPDPILLTSRNATFRSA